MNNEELQNLRDTPHTEPTNEHFTNIPVDSTFPLYSSNSILDGKDLHFFYYDINVDILQGWSVVYDWNAVVSKFKDVLDIDFCETESIPKEFRDNYIRFSVSNKTKLDNGIVTAAFFRHLRNAFAHFHIIRKGEWFEIIDCTKKGKEITMRGRIEADLLKKFCFCFFDQREEILSSQN